MVPNLRFFKSFPGLSLVRDSEALPVSLTGFELLLIPEPSSRPQSGTSPSPIYLNWFWGSTTSCNWSQPFTNFSIWFWSSSKSTNWVQAFTRSLTGSEAQLISLTGSLALPISLTGFRHKSVAHTGSKPLDWFTGSTSPSGRFWISTSSLNWFQRFYQCFQLGPNHDQIRSGCKCQKHIRTSEFTDRHLTSYIIWLV